MAFNQTRFTYPQASTKPLTLSMFPVQKYYTGSNSYGQLAFDPGSTTCTIWRYVGRRGNRFNVNGFNVAEGIWDLNYSGNFRDQMRQDGWKLVGTNLGSDLANNEIYKALFQKTMNVPSTGQVALPVGYGKGFVPGLKVFVGAVGANAFFTGVVLSYEKDTLTVFVYSSGGSGTHSTWTMRAEGHIVQDSAGLSVTLTSYEGLYDQPGLYADVWEVETNEGVTPPIVNYFRLHPRTFIANHLVPSTWFRTKLWPSQVPFQTNTSKGNPGWEMMVGVEPYHMNYLNPCNLDAFKAIMSNAQVQLVDCYFYRHETEGDIIPPQQVSVGQIAFDKQIYNWFVGKVSPSLFSEPGEYRLKFRIVWQNGPYWSDADTDGNSHYHDFWKTVIVDRAVDGISNPLAICMANSSNIIAARSSCSIVLGFNETETTFTQLIRSSASDLLEPRDPEVCYDSSQASVPQYGTTFSTSANSDIDTVGNVDTDMLPLVIADGALYLPDDPVSGRVPAGSSVVERDYQVEGAKINLTTAYSEFSQSLYLYRSKGDTKLGSIETFFADQSVATIANNLYSWTYEGGDPNQRFQLLAIVETGDRPGGPVRRIIPQNRYSVDAPNNKLNVDQSYIEGLIPLHNSARNFRIAYYRSVGSGMEPKRIRTQINWIGNSGFVLEGKPNNEMMQEIVFVDKKVQIRYLDYNVGVWSTSGTQVNLDNVFETVLTVAVSSGFNFEVGRKVRLVAPNGYYAEGKILEYSGFILRFYVEKVYGSGVNSSWVLHTTNSSVDLVTLSSPKGSSESFVCVYDARV